MKLREKINLRSGRVCELIKVQKDMIPNYYLVTFPKVNGQPNPQEVTEMIQLGIHKAKEISNELLGDEEAFTILYSGYSSRREKGWHIHIVLLGNRWKKAWLYLILTCKNLLQALGLRKDDAPKFSS